MLCDFFLRKVRWSYFSKGSMWLVCLIVLNGVGHKNWRVRNSTMYRTVQRNFDLQPFTLKTKRLLRHITRWCTSNKVTMVIRYYLEGNLYSITQIVKRTNILHRLLTQLQFTLIQIFLKSLKLLFLSERM